MKKMQKIFYAEDDEDIKSLVTLIFEINGYAIDAYDSGKKLLEALENTKPDLIILDVMMPEMSGLETLERLRTKEQTKEIPVIFMSAKVQANEIKQYLSLGAIGVISKPFDHNTLVTEIESLFHAQFK